MRKLIGAVTALVAISVATVGCTLQASDGGPTVNSADLQADIAQRLADAGEQPDSVSCQEDLVGEVGQTTRCDVVLSPTNSFQPVVVVTGVQGATIDYEMRPALSDEQLERAVVRLLAEAGAPAVTSIACPSGLLGELGAVSRCDVTAAGVTLPRTVEVTGVDGLMMNFDLVPILTRAELERSLLDELAAQLAARPDSVSCAHHLEGRPGTSVDCLVVVGDRSATFTLTVTGVDGAKIDYSYAPRPEG